MNVRKFYWLSLSILLNILYLSLKLSSFIGDFWLVVATENSLNCIFYLFTTDFYPFFFSVLISLALTLLFGFWAD